MPSKQNADPDDLIVGAFDGRDSFICFHARVKTDDERRWSEMLEENVANKRWKKTPYVNAARWQRMWRQIGAHTVDVNAAFYQ